MALLATRETMLSILFIAAWVIIHIATAIIFPVGLFGFATNFPYYPPTIFDEVNEICTMMQRFLPVPTSKQNEDELISKFKSLNDSSECEMFYLGYKQTEPRYASLDGSTTWPSLSISLDVSQPSLDRDCLEFSFQPVQTVGVKPCKDVKSTCYYFLYNRSCAMAATRDLAIFKEKIDIVTAFHKIKLYTGGDVGIAVVDDNYYSSRLSEATPSQNSCVALAVRYRFRYSTPDGTIMPYKSDRFVGDDAEADCLAVKVGNKTTISAESCDETVCVVCTKTNF